MPGRFDHCKVAFAERLFQIVHAGDVATVVFGRSGGFRFAYYSATVLHIDVVVLGAIGRRQPAPDRAAAPCSLPDRHRTGVVAAHLVVGPPTRRSFVSTSLTGRLPVTGCGTRRGGGRLGRASRCSSVPVSVAAAAAAASSLENAFSDVVSLSSFVGNDTTADTENTAAAVR